MKFFLERKKLFQKSRIYKDGEKNNLENIMRRKGEKLKGKTIIKEIIEIKG